MGDGGRRDVEFGCGAGEALVASRSLEHRPVRLHIDHAAGARKRRVIRGRRLQPEPQEAPHRQRVRRTPRDAALRIDAFAARPASAVAGNITAE